LNIYIILHIFVVIGLIGPLILTPRWLYLYKHEIGKEVLHDVHRLTGISGLLVFLSGGILLWIQDFELLSFTWMQVSIGIFIGLQLFDHFWADAKEEALETNPELSVSKLKFWLLIKLGLYSIITLLMILKPL